MIVDGPDGALNVEIRGDGDPVTVFAHGITGSTDELLPLAPRVRGTRVLMDFRGHGSSASPPASAGYDHPAMRRDLEAVADRFAARRAVGLSMGAGALLDLLADHPDRFERFVLVSPASIDAPNEGARGLFLEMADRLERDPLEAVAAWSIAGSRELIAREPRWEDAIRARVARMNPDGSPRALRAYVNGRPPLDDARALSRVRAPALILAHDGDPIHDSAIARRLAVLLPNARLHVWPQPLAMFDDEDALAQMIASFLDEESL